MKSRKSSLTLRSFEDLKDLIKTKPLTPPKPPKPPSKECRVMQELPLDEELFAKAMMGVTPIPRDNHVEKICQVTPPEGSREKKRRSCQS